ncbi:MAG: sugar phosphate isomerase/epimerase [Clostridia bacterium]|nr:sugar phosphate isomerase/epimerase [Clostridia bacterium]
MLLSTSMNWFAKVYGDCGAIRMFAASGFDAVDYTMGYMTDPEHPINGDNWYALAREIRQTADECGIKINQAHAPYPVMDPDDPVYTERMIPIIRRCFEVAEVLGIETMIIHPINWYFEDDIRIRVNTEYFRSIEYLCEKHGVKAALENIFRRKDGKFVVGTCGNPDLFMHLLDTLGDRHFTGCLDTGHCKLMGYSAADVLRKMGGKRITALHVHDNDGLEDLHSLPFLFDTDWTEICNALRDINYSGHLTFEADRCFKQMPSSLHAQACRYMCETGRTLIKMIEG